MVDSVVADVVGPVVVVVVGVVAAVVVAAVVVVEVSVVVDVAVDVVVGDGACETQISIGFLKRKTKNEKNHDDDWHSVFRFCFLFLF